MTQSRDRGLPVEIAFRGVHPTLGAEQALHRNLRWLAESFPELTGCQVLVEPGAAAAAGSYHVRIDLTVPRGRLDVEAQPPGGGNRGELKSVIGEAFDRARRELALRRRRRALAASRLF